MDTGPRLRRSSLITCPHRRSLTAALAALLVGLTAALLPAVDPAAADAPPGPAASVGPGGQVVVTLRPGAGTEARGRALVAELRGAGSTEAAVSGVGEQLDIAVLEGLREADAAALADHPDVVSVEPNRTFRLALANSTVKIGADRTQADGLTGAGQVIAVIDSGVHRTHPALSGAVVAEACYAQDASCPGGLSLVEGPGAAVPCTGHAGRCAHGTQVAGIAAGRATAQGAAGVAPGASVVAARVFDRTGVDATLFDVLQAMDWVLQVSATTPVAVVNMSFTDGAAHTGHCDADASTAFKQSLDRLRARGITVVAAAGNESGTGMGFPACLSTVVGVAASTLGDTRSGYSNVSTRTALFAPGDGVLTPTSPSGYARVNGTSMAAPHVAGAFAVLRQLGSYSSAQMLHAMRSTGPPISTSVGSIPRLDLHQSRLAPQPPTRVTATHGDRRATVSWTNTAKGLVTGYRVTASPGGQAKNVSASARSVAFTGLTNGTRYTFRVSPRYHAGTAPSGRTSNLVIPKPAPPPHGFPDVPSGVYYDQAVRWLKAEGITGGVGATGRYRPDVVVTRAQMAAFLWRLTDERRGYGAHGFPDVPGGVYYDQAVRWLKAEGITGGVGATGRYQPDVVVTRAQMAAFLWRLAGRPTGYPAHGFPDVPSGVYYDQAVRWLKAEGITTGYGGANRFAPDVAVTRAQLGAFLHRLAQGPTAWKAATRIPSTIVF